MQAVHECACGNAARYIDEKGELCCAICPIKNARDSIRLSDVPDLLRWCRTFIESNKGSDTSIVDLRYIIGARGDQKL
jgi:hypothetical protein